MAEKSQNSSIETDGTPARRPNRVGFVSDNPGRSNESDLLYILIGSEVFGSDKDFEVRRDCRNIREYVRKMFAESPIFEVGTRADGYRIENCDECYLMPCLNLEVLCTIYDSQRKPLSFTLVEIPGKPTYCKLKLVDSDVPVSHPIYNICQKVGESYYLTAKSIKENYRGLHDLLGLPSDPTVSGTNAYKVCSDFLIAIHCSTWPPQAFSMVQRQKRHQWPPQECIDKTVRIGCYVVPGSDEDLAEDELKFRLSFDLAIRELISSFNQSQRNLLGLVLLFIKKSCSDENICSMMTRAVKHCMFWTVYEVPPPKWDLDFRECFSVLVERISETVEHCWCASFFVRQCDVYEGKVDTRVQSILKPFIRNLKNDGLKYFFKMSEFSHYQVMFENVEESIYQLASANTDYRHDLTLFAEMSQTLHESRRIYLRKLPMTLSEFQLLQKGIRNHCPPNVNREMVDIVLEYNNLLMGSYCERSFLHTTVGNKDRLKHIGIIKLLLEKGAGFDLAAGNLKLATFCLFIDKPNECKTMVDMVLKNFIPSVVIMSQRYSQDGLSSTSSQVREYIRSTSGIELSVSQKMRGVLAYWVEFYPMEMPFIPKALKYELQSLREGEDVLLVDPLVYAHFLKSSCSYILDTEDAARKNNIVCLRRIVNGTEDSRSYHVNLNLLGYCYILARNIEEAKKCFHRSLGIRSENNAASKHLEDILR